MTMRETETINRRAAQRFRKLSATRLREFRLGGEAAPWHDAELVDISVSGALLVVAEPFAAGAAIELQMRLVGWTQHRNLRGEDPDAWFGVLAEVVRRDGTRCAVHFTAVDEHDRLALETFLRSFHGRGKA